MGGRCISHWIKNQPIYRVRSRAVKTVKLCHEKKRKQKKKTIWASTMFLMKLYICHMTEYIQVLYKHMHLHYYISVCVWHICIYLLYLNGRHTIYLGYSQEHPHTSKSMVHCRNRNYSRKTKNTRNISTIKVAMEHMLGHENIWYWCFYYSSK